MGRTHDHYAQSMLRMVLAALSFSVMAAFVKYAAQTLPSMEVVFFRSLFGSIAVAVVILKYKVSWIGKQPKVHALRGLCGFCALSLFFYAVSRVDLGTAVMLNFTAPVFAVVISHFLLKEKTTWRISVTVLISFVGLYLLAAPHFEAKPVPILLGVLSGIFAAFAHTLIRVSRKGESPYTIIFYFGAISTIASLPFSAFGFVWPTQGEWLGLLGVSAAAFSGQIFLTKSIQGAPVPIVMPFRYLSPFFATLFGFLFWGEYFTRTAALGAAIIVACGVSIYLLREKRPFVPLEK